MSWNIKTPGDYINGPLTVAGAALFNSSIGIGEAATNGIKLLTAVANGGFPATSGTLQSSGSIRVTASDTTGCLDIGTAGAVSWIQACRRTNLADNFALVLNPNGGNVGIGTTNPLARLHNSNGLSIDSGLFNGLVIGGTGSSSARTASFIKNTSSPYDLIIRTQDFSGTTTGSLIVQNGATEVFRINSNAAAVLAGGNVNANGVGIAFPAAQSASTDANTLDDYEEGTWTPVLRGSSVAGSYSFSFGVGKYTKIGRLVMVNVSFVDVTEITTGTGVIQITGLPFQIPNDDPGSRGVVGELLIRQCNSLSTAKNMYVQGSAGSSTAYFNYFNGTDDVQIPIGTIISGQTDFGFTLTYNV